MRAAIRYPWEDISTVKEIEEITTECIKYEGKSIPLLVLIEKDGSAMGFRLYTHEIRSTEDLITEALVKGYVDLRDRKCGYFYDDYYNEDSGWEKYDEDDSDDDDAVRIGRYYPE